MSTDLKLSKAQISKIIQSGGFLGSLLSKLAGPLMKVTLPLAKTCFSSIRNYCCCFSNWCGIHKKLHGSGTMTLMISNKEMNDIMEIVQALEDSNILFKGVTETIKNETKEQKGGFLGTLVGTLGSVLLGNSLSGKGIVWAGSANKKGKGIVRACREL